MPPDKERIQIGRGTEQQATFGKAKTVVKQIKSLGLSQAGLPFELDVSDSKRHGSGTVAETTEGESLPRILVPVLEAGKNYIPHRTMATISVHNAPSGRASKERMNHSLAGETAHNP